MQQGKLLKAILIFITYLFYMPIVGIVLKPFNLNETLISFLAEALFLIVILIIYRKKLKESCTTFFKEKSTKEKLFLIGKWFVIIEAFTIITGMMISLAFPNVGTDDNTQAIYELFKVSSIYSIFHTMIFGVVAEELVFRQNLRDVIKNNTLFIVTSSFLYAMMNIVYTSFSISTLGNLLQSFLGAAIFSYLYIKDNDNIFTVIVVKFCCNLIPLILLFTGTGA